MGELTEDLQRTEQTLRNLWAILCGSSGGGVPCKKTWRALNTLWVISVEDLGEDVLTNDLAALGKLCTISVEDLLLLFLTFKDFPDFPNHQIS